MSDNSFLNNYQNNVDKFYRSSLKQFKFHKKLLGTKVTILRSRKNTDSAEFFGDLYTSELNDDNDFDKLTAILILPDNMMVQDMNPDIDEYVITDIEQSLLKGDVITFTRLDKKFSAKVTDSRSLSRKSHLVWQFTCSPIKELS